ncbi:MAG: hypothetical protein O3A25_07765 [Acidobacteria bacterium]|nr:hypothetical protein [Acidobacteriota bacterium]
MDIKVKQIGLWRTEVVRRPGALADALEPLAQQGADLTVVRVRAAQGRAKRNVVEVYAGGGRRSAAIARAAGFSLSPSTTLLMQGDNWPGFAYAVANAVAWAGIGVRDHEAGVVDQRFSSTLTFATESDAKRAAAVIRRVIRAGAPRERGERGERGER